MILPFRGQVICSFRYSVFQLVKANILFNYFKSLDPSRNLLEDINNKWPGSSWDRSESIEEGEGLPLISSAAG